MRSLAFITGGDSHAMHLRRPRGLRDRARVLVLGAHLLETDDPVIAVVRPADILVVGRNFGAASVRRGGG